MLPRIVFLLFLLSLAIGLPSSAQNVVPVSSTVSNGQSPSGAAAHPLAALCRRLAGCESVRHN